MSRFLAIPLECRLRIYEWYSHGVTARLSVNSREMDESLDKDSEHSVSFDFQQQAPSWTLNTHLHLLGVCRQIRSELLSFLATSRLVTVGRSTYPANESLPCNGLRFLENTYAGQVQRLKTCTCIGLFKIPLDVFPGTRQLILKQCVSEVIGGIEKQVEWYDDITLDADIMKQVRGCARKRHASYKEGFGLGRVNSTCTLELALQFGRFGVSVTAMEDEVRNLVKKFWGPILDVDVKETLGGNPVIHVQFSPALIEARSYKFEDLIWHDPRYEYEHGDEDNEDDDEYEEEEVEEEKKQDRDDDKQNSGDEDGDCQLHEYYFKLNE